MNDLNNSLNERWLPFEKTGRRLKELFILTLILCTGFAVNAQTITGVITDAESGDPVIGASVLEKGTENNGTITDFDGHFELQAQTEEPVLIISYVGYQTMEVAYTGEEMNIILSAGLALDEVVVTALGIKREKKALGYAVQEIDGGSLVVARENNIANAISGKVAGLQIIRGSNGPASSSKIVLRGNNSLTGDNQPLIVIDGVPMDNFTGASNNDFWAPSMDMGNGLGDLNPENIESMSVLKGASAAALYGSRAGNGVILITTKTGKLNEGLGITYSGTLGSTSLFMKPELQSAFGQGNSGNYNMLSTDSWGPQITGQSIELYDGTTGTMQARDNIENYFRSGTSWNHSLAFDQQVSESSSLYSSINYLTDNSMIPGSSLDRLNMMTRSVSNFGPEDRWTTDIKVQYIKSSAKNRPLNGADNISNAFRTLAMLPRSIDVTSFSQGSDEFGNMIWWLPTNAVNPYWGEKNNLNEDTRNRFMVNGSVRNQLTDWMYAEIKAGFDLYNTNTETKQFSGSPLTSTGRYSLGTNSFTEGNYSALISASRDDLLGRIGGSLTLGGNLMHQTHRSLGSNSGELEVPNLFSLNNGKDRPTVSQGFNSRKINSLYGTAGFNYDGYLFLDITGRNDWSSTLSKENRSFFYPSVSASWVISDMVEYNGGNLPQWLMFAKLRASYAEVGNDLPPYQLYNFYNIGNDPNGNTTASKNGVLFNPDVRSELIKSWEVGFDVRLFNNRLGIDLAYYKSNATRQLLNIPLNPLSGYNAVKVNAGNIENAGFELALDAMILDNPAGLSWNANLNVSRNVNTVIELTEGVSQYGLGGFDNLSILAVAGKPYGEIYGTSFRRVDDKSSPYYGKIIVDESGLPLGISDPTKLGNQQPDAMVGFTNTFSYKNFSLSVLIDGRFGGEIFSGTNRMLQQTGNAAITVVDGKRSDLVFDGVVEKGEGKYEMNTTAVDPEDYWAVLSTRTGNLGINEFNIYDATNVRIRNVQLNYAFPKQLIQNTGLNKLMIGASMNNVAMLKSHLKGVDPESVYATATNAVGFENLSSPTARSIYFNLVVGF